jgi:hypothetical protein
VREQAGAVGLDELSERLLVSVASEGDEFSLRGRYLLSRPDERRT